MYIDIENYEHCSELGVVFYEVQIGVQTGSDVLIHLIKTRFSQLARLHDALCKAGIGANRLNPFPPEYWLWNLNKNFISTRRRALQEYLCSLTRVSTIVNYDCFRRFVQLA
jgi:hypothetical protein